jgi:tetratricopeptide (TPR) repeat protein
MENYKKSLDISEKLGDKGVIALCYMNMGLVNHKLSKYEQSLKNYKLSSKIAKKANDIRVLSFLHGNFGLLYTDMGDIEHALEEFQSAKKIFEQMNETRGLALNKYDISKILFFKDESIKSIPLLKDASLTLKKLGDLPYYSKAMLSLTMIQRMTEHNDEAMQVIEDLEKNYEILSNTTKERLNIEKAILIFTENKNLEDLLKLADETKLNANKAYIYYNIWHCNHDEKFKKKSAEIFNKLYIEKPKYRFKHFINKLS